MYDSLRNGQTEGELSGTLSFTIDGVTRGPDFYTGPQSPSV